MKNLAIIKDFPQHDLMKDYFLDAVTKYGENTVFFRQEEREGKKISHSLSYHEFWEEIHRFGAGLIHLGLQGKRVALIGFNSYEWVLTFLAVLCGVGVIVPLDKELTEEDVRRSLMRAKCDAVVFDAKHQELMRTLSEENFCGIQHFISTKKLSEKFPSIREIEELGSLALTKGDAFSSYAPDPDEMACLVFTSGTTSTSKAVMLSNRNLSTVLFDLLRTEEFFPTDRNLIFLPLHHTFGFMGLMVILCNGATNIFCDGLRYIQKNLKDYQITTFIGVPLLLEAMYRNIWKAVEKRGMTKKVQSGLKMSKALLKIGIDARKKIFRPLLAELGGALRFVISGASSLSKEAAEGFNDFGILTVQGYGLTETSPALTSENRDHIRYGSVGLPMPSVEITIENAGEDGIGEIVARGNNVMLGYYEMEEETAKVIRDGKFYTGDLGRLDEDGYLFVTGRKKNVIVLKNGKNIYPEELEERLSKLPFVSEVMVYGKDKEDDLLVSAKIVYSKEYFKENAPEKSEAEIGAWIKEEIAKINEFLPAYQHIKNLVIQTAPLSKTSTAKVKRQEEIAKGDA